MRYNTVTLQGLVLSFAVALGVVVAATSCGAAQTGNPKKSNNRLELAKDFLSRHQLDTARDEAKIALKLDSQNAEAYLVLGLVDILKALDNYRLLEIDNCLTGVDAEGLREEMRSHLLGAVKEFSSATDIDSEYSEAYSTRCQALTLLHEYDEAVVFGLKALEVPHRLSQLGLTRANLGWARFHSGDDVGAAKELRQALQFSPNMCVAKYRLGRVYFKREEWNKALVQFQAVVNSSECHMQEANLYLVRTMTRLPYRDGSSKGAMLGAAIRQCVTVAPGSCIAAECQSGV